MAETEEKSAKSSISADPPEAQSRSRATSAQSVDSNGSRRGSVGSRSRSLLSRSRSRSSLSQSVYFQETEVPPSHILHDLTDKEVIDKIHEMERDIKRAKVENGVFQRFLEKNEPEGLVDKPSGSKRVSIASVVLSKSFSQHDSIPKFILPSQQKTAKAIKINMTQKSDLVMRDQEMIQNDVDKKKNKLFKVKHRLVAQLEETETTEEELKASLLNIEEYIKNCEQLTLAKFARFMDEWSKSSRLMADKTRLRFSSLKVQHQKLISLLNYKQMIGENLQEIDFEQLRIENLHLTERIEKKTLLLMELKKMTGEANLKLTQNKEYLQNKINKKVGIEKTIKKVERDIARSDDDLMKTSPELEEVKTLYRKWKMRTKRFAAPEVLEYVQKKIEVDLLKKDVKGWSRRSTIKSLALDIKIAEMKKVLQTKKVHPSWFR